LEVLVATALMGLVMVVLLQVLSMALRTQEAARGHYQAVLVAERVLQEYCLLKSLQSGVYQGQDGRFAYEVRLTIQYEVADENLAKKLRCCLIQVTVSWREGGRVRSLNLQTLRTVAQEKA
jgi:type II secretory pathway pseudopilin PulG